MKKYFSLFLHFVIFSFGLVLFFFFNVEFVDTVILKSHLRDQYKSHIVSPLNMEGCLQGC